MSKTHENSAEKRRGAQKNYERIMKNIKPFIRRPDKIKPPRREVWRRGDDLPGELDECLRIEHHIPRITTSEQSCYGSSPR